MKCWVKVHSSLCAGSNRELSRATRFVYLEICLQARMHHDFRDDGSAWIPILSKGTVPQAIRDLIGGNAMEIVKAWDALSVGDDPMLRVETDPSSGRARRYLVVNRYADVHGSASETWSRLAYAQVYERDDHLCRYCGSTGDLTIDHVTPRCQGGGDEASNLVVACRSCNSRKGGRTPEQAGMTLLPTPGPILEAST